MLLSCLRNGVFVLRMAEFSGKFTERHSHLILWFHVTPSFVPEGKLHVCMQAGCGEQAVKRADWVIGSPAGLCAGNALHYLR